MLASCPARDRRQRTASLPRGLGAWVAALAAFLSIGVASAAAAPTWKIQPTAIPAGGHDSTLNGVSCRSANLCTAVGSYTNSAGRRVTLAERWNGTSWKIQSTPNPTGETKSYLVSVSCTAANACTAVGTSEHRVSSAYVPVSPLAERWNGATWKIQPVPKPAGAKHTLFEHVSCAAANACTAVGWWDDGGQSVALAERWNGATWKIQPTPNPAPKFDPSQQESVLYGVSCTAANACTGVGYFASPSGPAYATLAERWNGTSWKIQSTPNPAGSDLNYFYGVSCPALAVCTAFGYSTYFSGGQPTLAERWNGTSWKIQPTPNPAAATETDPADVSCTAANACTAVGYWVTGANKYVALAERWNGTSWKLQPTPNPAGASERYFDGVSCSGPNVCTAVGAYITAAGKNVLLAERWSGAG